MKWCVTILLSYGSLTALAGPPVLPPYPNQRFKRTAAEVCRRIRELSSSDQQTREAAGQVLFWIGELSRAALSRACYAADLDLRTRARTALAALDMVCRLPRLNRRSQRRVSRWTPKPQRKIWNGLPHRPGRLSVFVSAEPAVFEKRFLGRRLLVLNDMQHSAMFDFDRMVFELQAEDRQGRWHWIETEYSPGRLCGVVRTLPYHVQTYTDSVKGLIAGHYWEFAAPRYTGSFQTRLRYRLHWRGHTVYSNFFTGRINPSQLWMYQTPVQAGLRWLRRHQHAGGRWSVKEFESQCMENYCGGAGNGGFVDDIGLTGLTTQAFLRAGHTHRQGRYKEVVKKALRYLMKVQQADGWIGRPDGGVHNHALAAAAFAQAYALTQSPLLRHAARKAAGPLTPTDPLHRWRAHEKRRLNNRGALEAYRRQRLTGDAAGSWDPAGPRAKMGGRVYATVMMLLRLQQIPPAEDPLSHCFKRPR